MIFSDQQARRDECKCGSAEPCEPGLGGVACSSGSSYTVTLNEASSLFNETFTMYLPADIGTLLP